MNTPLSPREVANANPPGSCQHGRVGHCTICDYDAAEAVSEVPC